MLDNYRILESMTGPERAKLVKTACRKLKKYGCEVKEVYISLFTHSSTITFEYENDIYEICALCVKDTWGETKVEVPALILKEIKQTE